MIPGIKVEKMTIIKEEPIASENGEKKSSSRRKDKSQTHLFKKKSTFKFAPKNKRRTVFAKGIEEKNELKKYIFSNKRLDQIFIKKIRESIKLSSVFDILGVKEKNKKNYDDISHELKKYEQKLGTTLSYENRISLSDEPPEDIDQILSILSRPSEIRTFNDIFLIKKYLLKTKIELLFKDEFENKEESIEKLLTFFGLEMKYRLFKEGEEVFKVGDSSVYLYLIIKGKIEILKPMPEVNIISGYEYFSYIMDLKRNKEEHLLNINLEENYKQFDIDKNEIDLLPAIYIHHIFELIKVKKKINFEEELIVINMTLKDLDLTPETAQSYEHLSKKIEEKLPFVPPFLLKKYQFIFDKKNKKKLKLIKYTRVLILGTNEFFGESAMGENEKRNATIRVLEDSYLGYLSANLYKTNFFAEKKLAMQNKIIFLNTRFFFKNINLKRFSKKYFNLFVYEKYLKGTILFNENSELNYVYFIEDGLVELTSTKTILEIEIFLKGLEEKFLLKQDENYLKYNDLKSRTKDLEDYLNKTQKSKILIVGRNESLGIESFFYGIPYFVTAKVISQRAKIFKISIEQLWQIINIETECIYNLKNLVLNKTKILQQRLFSMNNTRLVLLDNKILFNYEFDSNINYGNNFGEDNKIESKNSLSNKNTKLLNIPELQKNQIFSSSPLGFNGTKGGINHDKRKKNIFSQTDSITNIKKRNNTLIKSLSEFYDLEKVKNIKKHMKVLKLPSFEDRWLNHAKNEIKILHNDKQFISHFNFDSKNNTEKKNYNNEQTKEIKEKREKEENKNSYKNDENDININNNKHESIITGTKNNIVSDDMNKSPKLNKLNNSTDSILPSISNGKHSVKTNKNTSDINKFYKNNYSYSFNDTNEKNIIRTNLNSFKNSKILFKFFRNSKINDNLKKPYIKLAHKKFNNFYEIKNDYDKKKFNFYNDKKLFGFDKEKNKTIEITNFKESSNKSSDSLYSKYFNNKIKMNNKEILTKINEKTKLNENYENNYL